MKNTLCHRLMRVASITALVGLFAGAVQAATVTLTSTYNIPAGATYWGNGNSIKASGMGDGSQNEGQKPYFKLNAGSRLHSVILLAPGVDGVHYYGNGAILYTTWNDVGEDAATIKSGGTCSMYLNKASSAYDKFGQCNAASTWTLEQLTQTTSGKIIRQNGGDTSTCKFYYKDTKSDRCREAIGRTDSSSTRFYYRNLTVTNFTGSNGWWYGRSSQASTY